MYEVIVRSKEELAAIIRVGTPPLYTQCGNLLTYNESFLYSGRSPYRVMSKRGGSTCMRTSWNDTLFMTIPDLLAEATPENSSLSWVCDDVDEIGKERYATKVWPSNENRDFNFIDDNNNLWKYARLVTDGDLTKGED